MNLALSKKVEKQDEDVHRTLEKKREEELEREMLKINSDRKKKQSKGSFLHRLSQEEDRELQHL